MKGKPILIIFIIVPFVIFVLLCIGSGTLSSSIWNPQTKETQMKAQFSRDYDELMIVVEYLKNSEYNYICIYDSTNSGKMDAVVNRIWEEIDIDNEEIVQVVESLKKKGYEVVAKSNGTITFQRWSERGKYIGVIYSEDELLNGTDFFTEINKLSELGWYIYKEDYQEWKIFNE